MDYIEVNFTIDPVEPGTDILMAELSLLDFESFIETDYGLLAYVQEDDFNADELEELPILSNNQFKVKYSYKKIEQKNWNAEWESSFEPIIVDDRCVVRAPFHEEVGGVEYDIIMEPRMAFGTGHHETTFLMLSYILDMQFEGKRVMDMGCGTGVLAILAAFKGAKYVEAVDIDEWAYDNAIDNCKINNCNDIVVIEGGAEKLNGKEFDIIFANINRNILLQDMKTYADSLINKGELLLSGFYEEDIDMLVDEATKHGIVLVEKKKRNKWVSLKLKKEA